MEDDAKVRARAEREKRERERAERIRANPADASLPACTTEAPHTQRFDAWLAELPPQVRRAFETRSWDDIPPKWRESLRLWTLKMAEDLEQDRR